MDLAFRIPNTHHFVSIFASSSVTLPYESGKGQLDVERSDIVADCHNADDEFKK